MYIHFIPNLRYGSTHLKWLAYIFLYKEQGILF